MATPKGPHKYRYGRIQLTFPKEALAPDGRTISYRYRGYANGAELDRLANCVIPRSAMAVEMMDKRFGVHGKAGLRRGGASEGDVSITSTNELEPIEVRACQYGGTYPNCNDKPEDPPPDDGYCQDFPDDPMCAPGDDPGPGGPGGGDDPCYDCQPDEPVEPCNTSDPLVDSRLVQDGFDELWQKSNYGEDVPQTDRREQAGWIVRTSSGTLMYQPMLGVTNKPCGLDNIPYPPAGTVAFLHTHPWKLGERQETCEGQPVYFGEPSEDDRNTSREFGIPGYILDANGITKFSEAANINTDARYGRCGY
jgi:hypothetical protein